jgi:hypothetical protein
MYPAVQLFEYAIWLPPGVRKKEDLNPPIGKGLGMRQPSHAYSLKNNCQSNIYPHPGFAWAARREIFDEIGFFDTLIMGSGDVVIVDALCDHDINPKRVPYLYCRYDFMHDIRNWHERIRQRVQGKVSYIRGDILHLYHGSLKNRRYNFRDDAMKYFDFDPKSDLKLNADQCFEWASKKNGLHRYMRYYFWARNEDSCWKREIVLFFMRQKYLPKIFASCLLKFLVKILKKCISFETIQRKRK